LAKTLTVIAVKNERPGNKRKEVSDGGTGLYLVVQPSGAKSWVVRYRSCGLGLLACQRAAKSLQAGS
jgi:hypothetical protein